MNNEKKKIHLKALRDASYVLPVGFVAGLVTSLTKEFIQNGYSNDVASDAIALILVAIPYILLAYYIPSYYLVRMEVDKK